jgi:hypothetical protein
MSRPVQQELVLALARVLLADKFQRTIGNMSTPGIILKSRNGVKRQVSTTGGIHPLWRPDGKELYHLNPAGAMVAAPLAVTGATLAPGAPAVLFPTRSVGGGAL